MCLARASREIFVFILYYVFDIPQLPQNFVKRRRWFRKHFLRLRVGKPLLFMPLHLAPYFNGYYQTGYMQLLAHE